MSRTLSDEIQCIYYKKRTFDLKRVDKTIRKRSKIDFPVESPCRNDFRMLWTIFLSDLEPEKCPIKLTTKMYLRVTEIVVNTLNFIWQCSAHLIGHFSASRSLRKMVQSILKSWRQGLSIQLHYNVLKRLWFFMRTTYIIELYNMLDQSNQNTRIWESYKNREIP